MNKIIKKKEYKTPSVNVFEIEMEDVIAASNFITPEEDHIVGPGIQKSSNTESNSRSNYYDRYSR